jgi:hypothetical protein
MNWYIVISYYSFLFCLGVGQLTSSQVDFSGVDLCVSLFFLFGFVCFSLLLLWFFVFIPLMDFSGL